MMKNARYSTPEERARRIEKRKRQPQNPETVERMQRALTGPILNTTEPVPADDPPTAPTDKHQKH